MLCCCCCACNRLLLLLLRLHLLLSLLRCICICIYYCFSCAAAVFNTTPLLLTAITALRHDAEPGHTTGFLWRTTRPRCGERLTCPNRFSYFESDLVPEPQ